MRSSTAPSLPTCLASRTSSVCVCLPTLPPTLAPRERRGSRYFLPRLSRAPHPLTRARRIGTISHVRVYVCADGRWRMRASPRPATRSHRSRGRQRWLVAAGCSTGGSGERLQPLLGSFCGGLVRWRSLTGKSVHEAGGTPSALCGAAGRQAQRLRDQPGPWRIGLRIG